MGLIFTKASIVTIIRTRQPPPAASADLETKQVMLETWQENFKG